MARRPGFTLLEIVCALAIAACLALGASYAIGRVGPRLDLRSGVWRVTSGLNQARFRAILSGEPVRVRFAAPGLFLDRYDLEEHAWRPALGLPLPGVAVRANNTPVFYPQGTVSGMATITVSNTQGSYRITIAITGRIRTVRTGRRRRGTRRSSATARDGGRRGGSSSGTAP